MKPSPRVRRRAVAAVWMLVVLTVLTLLMAGVVGQHLTGRRLLDERERQVQADWLARAGIERAAAHLLTDAKDYQGESIQILPASEVHITVRTGPGDTFQVTSEARYPTDDPRGVMRSVSRQFRRVVENGRARLEHE